MAVVLASRLSVTWLPLTKPLPSSCVCCTKGRRSKVGAVIGVAFDKFALKVSRDGPELNDNEGFVADFDGSRHVDGMSEPGERPKWVLGFGTAEC